MYVPVCLALIFSVMPHSYLAVPYSLQLLIALASNYGQLLNFLKTKSVPAQPQHSTTFHLTMFDTIEANDDATISWETFLRYFGGSKEDLGEGGLPNMRSNAEKMMKSHPGKSRRWGKFVLEQCTCEE